MVKQRDMAILCGMLMILFLVHSQFFRVHYMWLIIYGLVCIIYIFYKLGCNAETFWSISKKMLYWFPIFLALMTHMIYHLCNGAQFTFVLMLISALLLLGGMIVLTILSWKHKNNTQNEIILYSEYLAGYIIYIIF